VLAVLRGIVLFDGDAALADDELPLGLSQPLMLLRGIARGKEPHQSHQRADTRTEAEGRSPSIAQDDRGHQRRSQAGEADAGEDQAIRLAALTDRKPALDELAGGGEHRRLPGAQEEAQQDKDDQRISNPTRNKCDRHDKDRIPHAQQPQCAARTKPPCQHSGGNLQACVPDQECGEHPAHMDIVDGEFLANANLGNRDIDAVEVDRRGEHHQPEHQQIANWKSRAAGLT